MDITYISIHIYIYIYDNVQAYTEFSNMHIWNSTNTTEVIKMASRKFNSNISAHQAAEANPSLSDRY